MMPARPRVSIQYSVVLHGIVQRPSKLYCLCASENGRSAPYLVHPFICLHLMVDARICLLSEAAPMHYLLVGAVCISACFFACTGITLIEVLSRTDQPQVSQQGVKWVFASARRQPMSCMPLQF